MMRMKRSITATIDRQLVDWIEAEARRKDEANRSVYRNRSQVVENMILLGKSAMDKREREGKQ